MPERDLVVVSLGGDLLSEETTGLSASDQYEALSEISRRIAPLVERGHAVVVTHASTPQLGASLMRSELTRTSLPEVPLDVCGAETQGSVGYLLQQTLDNEFKLRGLDRRVATIITRVEVDVGDAAFMRPNLPIGPSMPEAEARERADSEGWDIAGDGEGGWRRVVPSPVPRRVLDREAVRALLDAGHVVIACGGGGIPVALDERGWYMGTAAVVDADLTSSLLARELGATVLIFATFSAKPKEKAIDAFLARGGKRAIVTRPDQLEAALDGEAGTTFAR